MNGRRRIAVCAAAVAAVFASHAVAKTPVVFEPTEARVVIADRDTPPTVDDSLWQTRRIPDNWNESQPGVGGSTWYRFSLTLDQAPQDLWAVHLERLRMNAAVFVNGVFIGDGGRFSEPVSRNWNRPLYFHVPSGLLRAGDNVIDVRVADYANTYGGLYGLRIGPDDELQVGYRSALFFKTDLISAFMVVTVVMGIFMATLWIQRRRDSLYGWVAAMMLLWAALSTHYFVRDLPLTTWAWEWFAQIGTDSFGVLLAISLNRFLGVRPRATEFAMVVYLIFGAAALATVPLESMIRVANFIHLGAVAVGLYVVGLLVWYTRRFGWRDSSQAAFAAAVAVHCMLGLHDWLLQCGLWQQNHWYLMHYASPVLFASLTWGVTSRFVEAHQRSEALNRELEQRVLEKHHQLADSYGRLRALEKEQAIAQERDRIMRDLHDGLGGHLVSALALVEGDDRATAIEETLRDALEDLRLVIDSLDPDGEDLPVLLGIMRLRVEKRIAGRGLHFDWQVRDVPMIEGFGPEMALQILRIVQEAFANVLKHARATTITVRSGETNGTGPPGVFLDISDDGQGIGRGTGGHGLENMRWRARSIGGTLDVTSTSGRGTSVRLWLPLHPTSAPPPVV